MNNGVHFEKWAVNFNDSTMRLQNSKIKIMLEEYQKPYFDFGDKLLDNVCSNSRWWN